MRLVCLGCGRTAEVPDTITIAGMPVLEWFDSRGQLCQDCRRRFGPPTQGGVSEKEQGRMT